MELAREECEKALEDFEITDSYYCSDYCTCSTDNCKTENCPQYENLSKKLKSHKVLKKLITEHFDNPPLKFEELKELIDRSVNNRIAIYDSKQKCWISVFISCCDDNLYYFHFGNECEEDFIFEENRFFARETKEQCLEVKNER